MFGATKRPKIKGLFPASVLEANKRRAQSGDFLCVPKVGPNKGPENGPQNGPVSRCQTKLNLSARANAYALQHIPALNTKTTTCREHVLLHNTASTLELYVPQHILPCTRKSCATSNIHACDNKTELLHATNTKNI